MASALPSSRATGRTQTSAAALPARSSKGAQSAPGEILVRFRDEKRAAAHERGAFQLRAADGRAVAAEVERFGGSALVEGLRLVRVEPEETASAIEALAARSDVLYAEPNYFRRPSIAPNDTRYSDQWALKNTGQMGGIPGADIAAESAWNTTTGSANVVVGVIDSGVDTAHRDLRDNIFVNAGEIPGNGVDDDGNGFVDDVNGYDFVDANNPTVFDNAEADAHGTHVAGILGARGNNAAGIAGVNWDVRVMPLKAIGAVGFGRDSDFLEAYQYALMMKQRGVNLRVLNNSYGGQDFSQSLRDAIAQLNAAGILFVAAAGNESINNDVVPSYPAGYDLPNVVSVAATSSDGNLASGFTNRGVQSVHLGAPGQGILSTTPRGYAGEGLFAAYTEGDGSTYSFFSGTSMAAPHVAGAAALALAANPAAALQNLRAAVIFNGDDHGSQTISGRRLNANKSVQAALENDTAPPAPAANFRIHSQNGRRVELRWNESADDGSAGARASLVEVRFTDATTNEQFLLTSARTSDPGAERTVFVSIPYKHTAGQLTLRTFDNVGNAGAASVNVSVAADVADPYLVSTGAPAALSAANSGTAIGLKGDDIISDNVSINFPFPFFGHVVTSVQVSSNGALYIPVPPDFPLPRPNLGNGDGAFPTTNNLNTLSIIAGLWTDIRTDRRASDNVYVLQPDRDRVIFRWQAVTFDDETPVNFEIELRRDGTIQTRYGDGNQNLAPVVVGLSGGDPEPYVVQSHTSETSPLNLTNAPTVTFALRNPPPPPTADLEVSVTANPDPVVSGQNITYSVRVRNLGPSLTEDLVMTNVLPTGATFVSCASPHIFATCSASNGTVTGRIASLAPVPHESGITFNIVANVTAPPGTTLQNTASATSYRADPNAANNSATVSSAVVAESFLTSVKAVTAGRSHTTIVRQDGTVWNWGTGSNGQLGDGGSGIGVSIVTPVQVAGLETVSSVADGNGYALALKSDGTVWGWGLNNQGQLGDGTQTERTRPVQTSGLTTATAIAAAPNGFYSLALKSDGTVWAWGVLGGLVTSGPLIATTPMQVPGFSNATAIGAGSGHILAIKSDGTVWAAGGNSRGQLGDGTTTTRVSAVQVQNLTNVVAVAAGEEFSLALKSDGTVWAWGINFHGELGPGGGPNDFSAHPTPIQVTGLPAGINAIAAGQNHCLALASDGTVWSWGSNGSFQLGRGSQISNNPVPGQIQNFNGVAALEGGVNHSVALKSDGSLWSWGDNTEGQLGDGTRALRTGPVRVINLEAVAAPAFNPPGGTFNFEFDVTVTCSTPGATIHYTTNGQTPTQSDPVVASGSTVRINSPGAILQARAWKPGLIASSTSFAQYFVNLPTNPIDGSQFFVTQHYRDFLGRDPDAAGLQFWNEGIERCGTNAQCREVKRVDTSAAFFLSIEFQETGYLVYRMYKAAYGDISVAQPVPLRREEMLPDAQRIGQGVIVGQPGWDQLLAANKTAFAEVFVARQRFTDAYPPAMTPTEFVAKLNMNTGGALTAGEANALAQELAAGNNSTPARASVLLRVADNAELKRREVSKAFVLMQYFGYLRRNPDNAPDTDFGGYNFWLTKLNQFGGDYRRAEMVKAFISSIEYRRRFGP